MPLEQEKNLPAERRQKALGTVSRYTGWTRFMASVPACGLFICAFALSLRTFADAVYSCIETFSGQVSLLDLATDFIEYADIFLLAVVLYIMALGLFTLFVSDKVPLPSWLEFHDFDDLKERLVSVICVMLGVYFLGAVLKGASGLDLLWLGIGTAIVVAAMTAFVHLVIREHE